MGNFISNSWKLVPTCRRDGEGIFVATRHGVRAKAIGRACCSRGKVALTAGAEEARICIAPQRTKRPTCEEA